MPIRRKDYATLLEESIDHLRSNSSITLLTPGSAARALLEATDRHIADYHDMLALNMSAVYLSEARGSYLDLLGRMYGLQRRLPSTSVVNAQDRSIRFYVRTGTLYDRLPNPGNLNQGQIPAGTAIRTPDSLVTFLVSDDAPFSRTATEVFVSAESTAIGDASSVGSGALTVHDMGLSDVYVTNNGTIANGAETESDEEFRDRISSYILTSEGANHSAVRLAALSVPGVADIRIVPWLMGAGSFNILIVPQGNRVSLETMNAVRRNVDSVVAFGMAFKVVEPEYIKFSMVVRLTLDRSALSSARDAVRDNAERAILSYMGTIRMGQEMVVTELIERVRQADPRIYDLKIEAMCFNGKLYMPHNFKLADDELFLPDPNLSDPVRVI